MTGSTPGRRVVRNSAIRGTGYLIGTALLFLTVALIARYVGVVGFGHYSFIMAVVGVIQLVADMGVRNVVIRDLAVDPRSLHQRLGVARTLLVALSIVSMGVVAVVAEALPLAPEVRQSMYLGGAAVMLTFYGLGYSAVLRAFEQMDTDILGFVFHKVVFLLGVAVVSETALGLRGVFVAMFAANTAHYLYFRILVGRRHGRIRLSGDFRAAWALLCESSTLGIAEVVRRLTFQVDRLLLTAMSTAAAVGLFSTASRLVEAMRPLALNLTLPMFPLLSRLARGASEDLFDLYAQSLRYLFVIAMPCAVIMATLAQPIVVVFFGEPYRDAATALVILAPVMVLLPSTTLFGYIFTALGRQRLYLICVSLTLVVNTGLDLVLIPTMSYRGAAVATVAGELTLYVAGVVALRTLGRVPFGIYLIARPMLGATAMGGILWLLRDLRTPFLMGGCVLGLAVYCALMLLTGAFSRSELQSLRDALRLRRAARAEP